MYFYINEFEVGVNDSIFPGNVQQKGVVLSSSGLTARWFMVANLRNYNMVFV